MTDAGAITNGVVFPTAAAGADHVDAGSLAFRAATVTPALQHDTEGLLDGFVVIVPSADLLIEARTAHRESEGVECLRFAPDSSQ